MYWRRRGGSRGGKMVGPEGAGGWEGPMLLLFRSTEKNITCRSSRISFFYQLDHEEMTWTGTRSEQQNIDLFFHPSNFEHFYSIFKYPQLSFQLGNKTHKHKP